MKLRAPVVALVCALLGHALASSATAQSEREQQIAEISLAITELRLEDAERQLTAFGTGGGPQVEALRGLVAFHRGRYGEAVSLLEGIGADPDPAGESMLPLMVATRDTVTRYVHANSPDGRYRVSHAPGPDAAIVPYAMRVLRGADEAISRALGRRVPGVIRLEIYPSAETLADVSSLTPADIARSGTIALCKWDRLMVTSPRALLRGYSWADTVSHELVHLILARASRDRAPVWVQEGIAKFLERAWRSPGATPRLEMDGVSRRILHEAVADNGLLAFERLHPSIALLPSQRDAALAFAQVSSFVDLFHRQHGDSGLVDLVARLARGQDAQEAFGAVAQRPFEQLESQWRAHVATIEAPPAARLLRRRLVSAMSGDTSDSADHADVTEAARRSLRLGDMLYGRRRFGAASREYARALSAAPEDPIVAGRVARAALQAGEHQRAIDALGPVIARNPDYAPARAMMSRALLSSGSRDRAAAEALEAIWLNPFDPAPHCVLAEAGEESNRAAEAALCRAAP